MGRPGEETTAGGGEMQVELWAFSETVADLDLTGFRVEAADGEEVGKVDRATHEVGADSIVVDTGPWIVGKKTVLPAGTIDRVDMETETIHVDRTRDEIKNAPEWDPTGYVEQEHRIKLAEYYSRFYS
jgi:hypothetical protein